MSSILILGKPNSGKSLLFNRLTGLKQKVANFPGATVELKRGMCGTLELIDFPGVYSLTAMTKDEEIAIAGFHQSLKDEKIKSVICTLDITRLERSLVFGLQAQALASEYKKPIIFALNMIDELPQKSELSVEKLTKLLGSPLYALSAKTLEGVDEFKKAIVKISNSPNDYLPQGEMYSKQKAVVRAREVVKELDLGGVFFIKNQTQIDKFFLHSFVGGIAFFLIMGLLFQSIFTWASPLMDLIEEVIGQLGVFVTSSLPAGIVSDFINDALFGGFGSFLVFAPQIMILSFIIGLLEDSGYLVRAALICHRPFSYFGLSGKSFIPYLSGFACSIPAMMAARVIESPKKRLITLITIPLMSCSARLPVYALFISAFVPEEKVFYGLLDLRGLSFFALYIFGLLTALVVSAVLSRVNKKEVMDAPFILELPPYRLPAFKPLAMRALHATKSFVVKAGPVIFSVTAIVWVLSYFPYGAGKLESSWLSQIGHFLSPLFQPLGIDWRYGVAILASFLAREVFVGVLGTLYGVEGADENIASLAQNIQADGLTFASAMALLVFYAIALQCISTVAMLKKESGSSKIAWMTFLGYSVLAYFLGLIVKISLS